MTSEMFSCVGKTYALTPTELRVLELICNGHNAKKIAIITGSSLFTIQNHLRAIYRKLGVNSKLEAVLLIISPNRESSD